MSQLKQELQQGFNLATYPAFSIPCEDVFPSSVVGGHYVEVRLKHT